MPTTHAIFGYAFFLAMMVFLESADCRGSTPWASLPRESWVAASTVEGRIVRGQIDARTDATNLWLTVDAAGIHISSRIGLADVVKVEPASPINTICRTNETSPLDNPSAGLWSNRYPITQSPTASSLAIYAYLENWDHDSAPDGLRLVITPRSPRGELVITSGTVSSHLTVYRNRGSHLSNTGRQEEQWSHPLARTDFGPRGAVLDLPFRSIRPADDTSIHQFGTLTVRLTIAGVGALDATLEDVELHPWSITRAYSQKWNRPPWQ